MESTSTSSSAVEAARTEAHRRHRLREMADADGVIFLPDGREVTGHDDETADHLRAAAHGELLGAEPGWVTWEPFPEPLPPIVAVDRKTAQKMASKPR